MDEILDHESDENAVTIEDMYVEDNKGSNPRLNVRPKGGSY
jgi:hypothetical protein